MHIIWDDALRNAMMLLIYKSLYDDDGSTVSTYTSNYTYYTYKYYCNSYPGMKLISKLMPIYIYIKAIKSIS